MAGSDIAASLPDRPPHWTEELEVVRKRYLEARQAGLTTVEARLFAESTADVGHLRILVKAGCPADTIRAIVL